MQSGRRARGFHLYPLPDGLENLERAGAGAELDGLTLFNADKTTLVWSQRMKNGERAIFKMYRHRGPVSWWREKRFRFRVQREYQGLTHLQRCGIPCSHPLFWFWDSCDRYGRYEVLVTREIPKTVPLNAFLRSRKSRIGKTDLRPLYTTVARIHSNGIHHGALYTRNILVTENESMEIEFHIIDLPKAILFPHTIVGTRMAWIDLLDLTRDLAKQVRLEQCKPLLMQYGFDEKLTISFMKRLKKYRPTRHTRNRHRAECELRELIAKF